VYLQQLYKRRKAVFFLLIVAGIVQSIVFIKQGAVFSPFYNYGMYSEKILPQPVYVVYKIYADDHLLRGEDFSIQEWDKIYLPVFMYLSSDSVNSEMMEIRNRLLNKIKLTAAANTVFFDNEQISDASFMQWYRNQLSGVTGNDIKSVSIFKYNYHWNKSILTKTDSTMVMQSTP
jgi:hypothetical protein